MPKKTKRHGKTKEVSTISASLLSRISDDVILEILEFFSSPLNLVKICLASRRFRSLALNARTSWSFVNSSWNEAFVRLCIRRSGDRDLSVRIANCFPEKIEAFLDIVIPACERWSELDIDLLDDNGDDFEHIHESDVFQDFCSRLQELNLPKLRRLEMRQLGSRVDNPINFDHSSNVFLHSVQLPCLHSCHLVNVMPRMGMVNNALTTLIAEFTANNSYGHLDGIRDLVTFLRSAPPSLKTFALRIEDLVILDSDLVLGDVVLAPHIEEFALTYTVYDQLQYCTISTNSFCHASHREKTPRI